MSPMSKTKVILGYITIKFYLNVTHQAYINTDNQKQAAADVETPINPINPTSYENCAANIDESIESTSFTTNPKPADSKNEEYSRLRSHHTNILQAYGSHKTQPSLYGNIGKMH